MNFENIHFLFPLAFLLTFTFPLVIYGHFRESRRGIRASFLDDVQKVYSNNTGKSFLFLSLEMLLFTSTLFAFAQPVLQKSHKEVEKNGIDIVILLDISKSMLAEDITPSRIEAAKQVISAFVSKLTADRVGIILFAGKPIVSIPLTFDYDAIKSIISDTNTDSIDQTVPGLSGTAIGDGILSATDTLTTKNQGNEKRSKTIVLLTDGEANVGIDPVIATKYAASHQVKIYTIGIGKNENAPLYMTDPSTGEKRYFLDQTGKPIIATIDEAALKKIAETTGGQYFLANSNDTFMQIFDTLARLEKTKVKTKTIVTNIPLSPYLAWISLVCLFCILSPRLKIIS